MNYTEKAEEKALENFKNIQKSIKGIFDVLNLSVSEDLYFNAGKENIEGLYRNFLELMMNDAGLRKVAKKIQNSEVEVSITLDEYLVETLEEDLQ
ncbi:MAG: hypothetical protein KGD73_09840 [Candidatus Lokiarchaeota archaeon]|nr:hypothetical protein [Candidatus Lokiarchaeota archaeon]